MEIQVQMIWFQFFQLGKVKNSKINNINDKKIKNFNEAFIQCY